MNASRLDFVVMRWGPNLLLNAEVAHAGGAPAPAGRRLASVCWH